MTRDKFFSWALPFALGVLLAAGAARAQSAPQATNKKTAAHTKPVATATRPALEPKAIEILKASSDRLAAAHTLAFTALETYESPSRQGHPLMFVSKSEVTLQRPDKLRVIIPGDGPASTFYYNGTTMMAFAPAENLLALLTHRPRLTQRWRPPTTPPERTFRLPT